MRRFAKIVDGVVEAVFEADGEWPLADIPVTEVPDGQSVGPGTLYENGAFTLPPVSVTALEQIARLERQHMLPRAVREFMLAIVAERAVATGKLPTDLPAFVKLKALDDQIATLRSKL